MKQTIEEESKNCKKIFKHSLSYVEIDKEKINQVIKDSFIEGAKSESAKEYHQKDMFTKEELEQIARESWIESYHIKRNTDITGFEKWFNSIII